jgi:hypothetical protein
MSKSSVALIALLMISLTFPISRLSAQTHASDFGTAVGDVWSSREPYIYVPREAVELPNPDQLGDLELATGDVWPSRQNTPESIGLAPAIVGGQVNRQMTR